LLKKFVILTKIIKIIIAKNIFLKEYISSGLEEVNIIMRENNKVYIKNE